MGFGSYKTAWLMCHKVRAALGNTEFKQLIGYVEVDDTYIGGKAKNKHKGPGGRGGMGGRGPVGKTAIVGAVQRKGNVVARVIDKADTKTLDGFVEEVVSHKVSLLSTDDNSAYRDLNLDYPHGVVRHSQDEYVVGAIHTNTIEGFWSLVKRGVIGTFHRMSRKYMPLYVNEFEFRYNSRNNPDIFGAAIKAC
jgi:IS1 family transposase